MAPSPDLGLLLLHLVVLVYDFSNPTALSFTSGSWEWGPLLLLGNEPYIP